ncbi:MAG: accessory factor UbiK family protein [Pseudomonadota bacterium]
MQSQNRLLEDLAKVAGSAMGVAAGMRGEVEARLRDQFARILDQMELVSREEFEAVQAIANKAREEQEVLSERLAALEKALAEAQRSAGPAKSPHSKSSSKKAAPRAKKPSSPKSP